MILIYNYSWIREIISDGLVQSHLRGKGYQNPLDAALTLKELFTRLKNPKDFPHEIGFFLGYPFEDVIAFEKNRGQITPEADDIVKCQEWTKAAM